MDREEGPGIPDEEEEGEEGVAALPMFEGNEPVDGAGGDVRESVEVDIDDAFDAHDPEEGMYAWETEVWSGAEVRRRDSIFNDEEKMGVWTGRVEWPESGMRSSIKREALRGVGEMGGSGGREEGRGKRVRVR